MNENRARLSRSIKTRLTALVLGVLFAAMTVGILTPSYFAARSMRRLAEERIQSTAGGLEDSVIHWYQRATALVRLLRDTQDIASMDPARQKSTLVSISATYPEIFLAMTNDTSGMNVSRSDREPLISYSNRRYLKNVLQGSDLETETVISKTIGRPVLVVATPIRSKDSRVVGGLAIITEVTSLARAIGATHVGNTGIAYLVDSSNKAIAHPSESVAKVLTDMSNEEPVRYLRAHKKGALHYRNDVDPLTGAKGIAIDYVGYVSELDNGWGIVVIQQEREAYAEVTAFIRTGSIVLIVALFLVAGTMWMVVSRTMRPVERLTQVAGALANGALDRRVDVRSADEIGILGASFNSMADAIQRHVKSLADHQEKLEDTVAKRTQELARRNDEMRVVLDTVDQGLVTIDADGTLGQQRSAALRKWFRSADSAAALPDLFAPAGDETRLMMQLAWESVVENVLPLEVTLDQIPKKVTVGDRHYALGLKPIFSERGLESALLVVTDVTTELQRLQSETAQREFLGVFERLMKDRNGFIEFYNEASALVDGFATHSTTDTAVLCRQVHTLKGNSAVFGVQSIADVCHDVETQVSEDGPAALENGLAEIVQAWSRFTARVVPLIGTETSEIVEVPYQDLDAILSAARRGEGSTKMFALLERLTREPIEVRFRRAAQQARGLAARLGRAEPVIKIDGNGVRLPREGWATFWAAFVHLVRNAVDHGLESAIAREAKGKPPFGTIELSSVEIAGRVVIGIKDDGRGVDWELVRSKAAKVGLPSDDAEDLKNALFGDGFSTREEASTTSGRGMGMQAVRDACRAMDGTIEIHSEQDQGTTITISIPLAPPSQGTLETLRPATRASLHLPKSVWPGTI
jgi:two-component system chemotaxis sensor kinase CheA